jgi:hypothetical protein
MLILSHINKNEAPVKTRNFPGASRVTGKENCGNLGSWVYVWGFGMFCFAVLGLLQTN